jgi:UDP-N-acetylmuramate--alanine ligase
MARASNRGVFNEFANKIADKTKLFITNDLPLEGVMVSIDDDAVYKAFNIRISDGSYLFDIDTPQGIINDFSFALPGRHNLMNALMAIAMAVNFGTQPMPLQ